MAPTDIHRLDTDSLKEIFYQAIREDLRPSIQLTRLICITHVCCRWRTLALDLAELWGDVAFASRNPAALPVILERACDAPLSMTLGAIVLQEHLDYINEHPERLRSIETRRVQWDPAALAGRTLPLLEKALLVPRLQHTGHHSDLQPIIAPRLEDLTLNRFYIPFSASKLRSLFIYGLAPFNLKIMVSMLNAVPTLTTLRLDNCLPTSLDDVSNIGHIELPRIVHLDLRQSTCMGLITFLELLRPNGLDIAIVLTIGYVSKLQTEYEYLAQALRPFMHGTSRDAIDLNFEPPDYTTRPSFALYRSAGDDGTERRGEISVRVEDCAEDVTPLFTALFDQFTDTQIRHLELIYGENLDEGMPTHDFRRLLQAPRFEESLQTVRHHIQHPGFNERRVVVRICTLLFDESTKWGHLKELALSANACLCVLCDPEGASRLLSWLTDRAGNGCPLSVLRLQGELDRIDCTQMERLAQSDTWKSIRAAVTVVDEWTVLEQWKPPGP